MKTTIKVLLAFLCALIFWEFILEASVSRSAGVRSHPVLGRIPTDGFYLQGKEGFSIFYRNSLGMRAPDLDRKKDNEYRILVLGDSYTEAAQVSDQETFCSQLGQMITHNGQYLNIINAGWSGASPAYYIHLADYYIKTIDPDYIIIQLNEGDFTEDITNIKKPFYVMQNEEGYTTVQRNTTSFLTEKYPVISSWVTRLSVVQNGISKKESLFNRNFGKLPSDVEINIENPTDYEKIISFTLKTFKEKYKNVVIVFLPSINYSKIDQQPAQIDNLVAKYAQINNVPFINMRSDFINSYNKTHQPVHGFNNTSPGTGHINKDGHKLVAKQLAQHFVRDVLKQ